MKLLNRHIFNITVRNTNARKAMELYLFVKARYASSTIPNFTYKELSKQTGLCYSTLKKRLNILAQLGLIEYIGRNKQHLLFKSSRKKKYNIKIENIDFSSIKAISKGLCALFIVETQCRKEYIKQLLDLYHECKKAGNEYLCRKYNYKKIEKKVRKRGLTGTTFQDNGISYKYIAQALKIGYNKVADTIRYAEKYNILKVERRKVRICKEKGCGHAILKYAGEQKNLFSTKDSVYVVLANRYSLVLGASWYGITYTTKN